MKNVGIAEIIAAQVHLFLINVVYGILLGIWYEFFRTLRKNFAHKDKIVHLEDIIFCVTASLGIFILFQVYNQGIVRFYCLMGLECGILFYFFISFNGRKHPKRYQPPALNLHRKEQKDKLSFQKTYY